MIKFKMLRTVKGSRTGVFTEVFSKDSVHELPENSDLLKCFIDDGVIELIEDAPVKKAVDVEENKAIEKAPENKAVKRGRKKKAK